MHRTIYCLTRDPDYPPLLFSTEHEAQEFLDADIAEKPDEDEREYLGGPYAVVLPADPPAFNARELATVLAALRLWQRTEVTDPELLAIAAEGRDDFLCGLAVEEIDALWERLNCKTAQPPDSVWTSAVQSLTELIEICRWKCSPHDEVILPNGRTNHQALLDAVKVHSQLTE